MCCWPTGPSGILFIFFPPTIVYHLSVHLHALVVLEAADSVYGGVGVGEGIQHSFRWQFASQTQHHSIVPCTQHHSSSCLFACLFIFTKALIEPTAIFSDIQHSLRWHFLSQTQFKVHHSTVPHTQRHFPSCLPPCSSLLRPLLSPLQGQRSGVFLDRAQMTFMCWYICSLGKWRTVCALWHVINLTTSRPRKGSWVFLWLPAQSEMLCAVPPTPPWDTFSWVANIEK